MIMRKILLLTAVVAWSSLVLAQDDLTGRIYSNSNIFQSILNEASQDIVEQQAKKRSEAYAAAEKKAGRKLTAAEKAAIDKEKKFVSDEDLAKAKMMTKALAMGIKVEFVSASNMVMYMNVQVDDAALKAAGVPWLKRKAIKASVSLMPKSQEGKYIRKGSLVIVDPDDEPDTLHVSSDGKQLYGLYEKTKFVLTRTR